MSEHSVLEAAAAILSRPRITFDPGREQDGGPYRDPIKVGRGWRVLDGPSMTISGPYATLGAAMHRAVWLAQQSAARAAREAH